MHKLYKKRDTNANNMKNNMKNAEHKKHANIEKEKTKRSHRLKKWNKL